MFNYLLKFSTVTLLAILAVGPTGAQAKPFQHEFGELREYHKHWLGVCSDNAATGCRAVTMTHTSDDGFFLHGRLGVLQDPANGLYAIEFLDEDDAHKPNTPVTVRFSDGSQLTFDNNSVARSQLVSNELVFLQQSDIKEMIQRMRARNHMTIEFGGSRNFYSLIGFSSAMKFMTKYRPDPVAKYTGPMLNTSDFWGGEWPRGVTMKADAIVMARKGSDTELAKDVSCSLTKGATYHPWNHERNKVTPMTFKTIETAIVHQVTKTTTVKLERQSDRELEEIQFKAGDEWAFITYYGEGYFSLSYKGKLYVGEEEVYQWSETKPERAGDDRFEEWLGLPCDNGIEGWMLLADLRNLDEPEEDSPFGAPNFQGYGAAEDLVDIKSPD
jgi:hypothetical protein